MGLPSLVLVKGPPGSGKTTLARCIGDRLRWPVLSQDDVAGGLAATSSLPGAERSRPTGRDVAGVLDTVADRMLREGLSLIVEGVFPRRRTAELCGSVTALEW